MSAIITTSFLETRNLWAQHLPSISILMSTEKRCVIALLLLVVTWRNVYSTKPVPYTVIPDFFLYYVQCTRFLKGDIYVQLVAKGLSKGTNFMHLSLEERKLYVLLSYLELYQCFLVLLGAISVFFSHTRNYMIVYTNYAGNYICAPVIVGTKSVFSSRTTNVFTSSIAIFR